MLFGVSGDLIFQGEYGVVSLIPERRKYRIRIGCLVKTKNQKEERKKGKRKKKSIRWGLQLGKDAQFKRH